MVGSLSRVLDLTLRCMGTMSATTIVVQEVKLNLLSNGALRRGRICVNVAIVKTEESSQPTFLLVAD